MKQMADYYIRFVKLPRKVEGVTIVNSDGTFSVYINEILGAEERQAVLEHELRHIRLEHFYEDVPVAVAENAADRDPITIEEALEKGMLLSFPDLQALKRYADRLVNAKKPPEKPEAS